jgi:LacI family transcriptional regulator
MTGPTRKTTIRDVARAAGVSFKTVSRVINGVTTVDPEIRSRVERAVTALAYRPNRAARMLGGGRSSTLAVMFGKAMTSKNSGLDHLPTFAVDVISGALQACSAADYKLMIVDFGDAPDAGRADLDRILRDTKLDGAILMPPWCDTPWLLDHLDERGVVYARILPGTMLERGLALTVDNRPAGEAIAQLLLDLGHRQIGLIDAPAGHLAGQARVETFLARLSHQAGVTLYHRPGNFLFEGGHAMGGELLDLPSRPTAIFAANDEMAAGVLAAAIDRNIDVPRDLSVMGYGDLWVSRQTWPRLSTVHQPIGEMTEAGAQALIRTATEGVMAELSYWPFSIMKRGSLASPAGRGT